MGQKDITEKLLEDYNDVFADIINGLIFKGEQRILPENLWKMQKSTRNIKQKMEKSMNWRGCHKILEREKKSNWRSAGSKTRAM